MAAAVLGPPIGFPNDRSLYPWMGHGPYDHDVEVVTADGTRRLQPRTIQKYLPNLWDMLADGLIEHTRRHGRPVIDMEQLHDNETHVVQTCLSQIFRHLKELDHTDGHASSLLDWLESIHHQSRRLQGSRRHHHNRRLKMTRYFYGLGKLLDRGHLSSHRKLFQIMANFLIKNCHEIFRRVNVEEFLLYVFALDRTGHDMSEVLATILSSIGQNGRRRLLCYDQHPSSVYHNLSSRTRRALRNLDDAKRHRQGGRGRRMVPYRGMAGDLVRRGAGRSHPQYGVIPRRQKSELLRRYGDEVRFQDWMPSDYTLYRIVSPRSRRRRRLGPAGRRLIADPGLPRSTFESEFSPSDDYDDVESTDFLDDDDYDYDLSPGHYQHHHHQHQHHGHGIPRRVSYGSLDESYAQDLTDYDEYDRGFTSEVFDDDEDGYELDHQSDSYFADHHNHHHNHTHPGLHGRSNSWAYYTMRP